MSLFKCILILQCVVHKLYDPGVDICISYYAVYLLYSNCFHGPDSTKVNKQAMAEFLSLPCLASRIPLHKAVVPVTFTRPRVFVCKCTLA